MIHQKLKKHITLTSFLQLVCSIATLYLVYSALFSFTVTRPTYISTGQEDLHHDTFPDISLCMNPALNSTAAQKYGYNVDSYFKGANSSPVVSGKIVGWNGINGDRSSLEILEDIMTVKSGNLAYRTFFTTSSGKVDAVVSLKWPTFPRGRCFLIRPPQEEGRNHSKTSLWILPDGVSHFSVYLQDPTNTIEIHPVAFKQRGDPIDVVPNLADMKKQKNYKIQMSRTYYEEGDPLFDCREYNKSHTYNDCVQNELIDIFLQDLGCVPPFLAKNEKNMCNRLLNLSEEDNLRQSGEKQLTI